MPAHPAPAGACPWVSGGITQCQRLPSCPSSVAAAAAAAEAALLPVGLGDAGPAFAPPALQLPPPSPFLSCCQQDLKDDGVEAGIEGWIAGLLSP